MQRREAFRILGLDPGAPVQTVKARFRGLVKRVHPDARPAVGRAESMDVGTITEAYRVISQTWSGTPRSAPDGRERREAGAAGRRAPKSTRVDRGSRLFDLGRLATSAARSETRRSALRELGRSDMFSAVVYVQRALFDPDPSVACEAASILPTLPGIGTERLLLEVFDRLSVAQRLCVLRTIRDASLRMPRLVAYATADLHPPVRRLAGDLYRWT